MISSFRGEYRFLSNFYPAEVEMDDRIYPSVEHSHDDLRDKLLATHPELLIEGNFWGGTFWGVCAGEGSNHLGRLLMKIRGELRNG